MVYNLKISSRYGGFMKKRVIFCVLILSVVLAVVFETKSKYGFKPVTLSAVPSHNIIEIAVKNFSEEINKDTDFPENMKLLEEQGAYIPELTHFDNVWYTDPNRKYTEYELQMLREQQTQKEYLRISSINSNEEIQCYWTSMYPIKIPRMSGSQASFTAYKLSDSNLFAGTIFSNDDKKDIKGKFLVKFLGYRLEDGVEISIGYFGEEAYEEFYALKTGVYQYDYTIVEGSDEDYALKNRGERILSDNYKEYSGIWYPQANTDSELEKESYLELTIAPDGEASGHMLKRNSSNKYQPFYGEAYLYGQVIGNELYLHYDNDCFGHSGNLTIIFYENCISVYLVEQGEPDTSNGFNTGTTYYYR